MNEAAAIDEGRIGRVLTRYCRFLDDGRWDDLVALFTDDCVFETMGRRLEGREQVREFFPSESVELGRPESMHLLANVVVDVVSDGAVAESDWLMVSRDDAGVTGIGLAGRYRDRLVRAGDDWRIAHRVVVALARPGTGSSS